MKLRAVIFDLFGTLVDGLMGPDYTHVRARMASVLSIPAADLVRLLGETAHRRTTGGFESWEANIEYVCRELAVDRDDRAIELAARIRRDFARRSMMAPKAGAVGMLSLLKERGLKTGLISDCTPDVPLIWPETSLAPLIDVPVFSCSVGTRKPDPLIYKMASEHLRVKPEDCLYVGDGGSDELPGAARVGMHPVLIRADAQSADAYRTVWEQWNGPAVTSLGEVLDLV